MKTLSIHTSWVVLGRIGAACALAASAVFAVPSASFACKCAAPPSATEALKQATAVFEAQVTQLNPTDDQLEVSMRVVRAWKGVEAETVRVRTRRETAACGVPFESGKSYLVYATQSTTPNSAIALEALRCGRTRPAEEADEDFAELGLGVVPVSAREPAPAAPAAPASPSATGAPAAAPKPVEPSAGGCASCTTGSVPHGPSALGTIAFAALIFVRGFARRRR